jgi:hypothetical protein
MKLPGEALIEFRLDPRGDDQCRLEQRALFRPRGLSGLLYWYAIAPLHHVVFRGMLQGIRREAMRIAESRQSGRANAPKPAGN